MKANSMVAQNGNGVVHEMHGMAGPPPRKEGSKPASRSSCRSSWFRGQSFPRTPPPTHLSAAAAITPSGVPPIPISRSTPVVGLAAWALWSLVGALWWNWSP